MNKKHSKSTFKDEWLLNLKYKSWLKKTSLNTGRCSFCNKRIDVSSMGVSALESHSNGKKHKQMLANRSKNYSMFFGKSSASSTEAEKSVENSSSENTCKNISTLDYIIAINENSLNAEIIWCLKVVNAHSSHSLSSDIAKLFQCMFPDSEIASQFVMGKTKIGT